MPSRLMHDFLVHLIETCEVEVEPQEPTRLDYGTSGFQAMYMGSFPPRIKLRRVLRESELYDLPQEVYREFIELLEYLSRSNEAIDVSRRFRGVRLLHFDTVMGTESLMPEFRMIFSCDSIDGEYDLSMTQRERMEIERQRVEVAMQEMMRQPRRSAMLPPDWFEDEKPKKVVKKKEDHFDKDLFEV